MDWKRNKATFLGEYKLISSCLNTFISLSLPFPILIVAAPKSKYKSFQNEGLCSGSAGIVFVDIISNLERIGDHAVNIAEAVLGGESPKVHLNAK